MAPARGSGPWNTYSWSPCSVRDCSNPTRTRAPSGAHRDAVVRNVGGMTAPGPKYSGASDCAAIANSRIFPRSTGYSYGVPTVPMGALTVPPQVVYRTVLTTALTSGTASLTEVSSRGCRWVPAGSSHLSGGLVLGDVWAFRRGNIPSPRSCPWTWWPRPRGRDPSWSYA